LSAPRGYLMERPCITFYYCLVATV
jgi:hypothetical protein